MLNAFGHAGLAARGTRALGAVLMSCALCACGDDLPNSATFVRPAYGDPCERVTCGNQGSCTENDQGDPICACNSGYIGALCESCAVGYHQDFGKRCVHDRFCADQPADPCGVHGVCVDADGVIACECDAGYQGARCSLCADGHRKNEYNECLRLVSSDGPGPIDAEPLNCSSSSCNEHGTCNADKPGVCQCYPGYAGDLCESCARGYSLTGGRCVADSSCASNACDGCEGFETPDDFPLEIDTCISTEQFETTGLAVMSLAGDGTVWLCAASPLRDMPSQHLLLEAGSSLPAQFLFAESPIASLSFDYNGRSELALQLLGDGEEVGVLRSEGGVRGTTSLKFNPPINVLELQSMTDQVEQLDIDNIVYEFADCR